MNKRNIETVYPLSPMQQGMLFHSLYAPESGVYFEQSICTLRGPLHLPAFKQAWHRVVERHAALRTSFVWKRLDKTLQVVHRQVTLPWEEQDWRELPPAHQEVQLAAFLEADRARGFNLAQAPLMRLALLQTGENVYQFVWSHHHLLLDGWSLPLLLKEVLSLYEQFRQGRSLHLEPGRPYRDYIAWLQQQDLAAAETFWRHALAGFTAPTPLVVDRGENQSTPSPMGGIEGGLFAKSGIADRAIKGKPGYAEQQIRLPAATTAAIQSLARQHQLTLNTLLQGVWALLLSRYSGEEDVVFGVTVSGRPPELAGVETMIGLFINTLPLRVQVRPGIPVLAWLKELQARQAELHSYPYSPLFQVQKWSNVPGTLPLFESILVFENYPVDASLLEMTGNGSLKIQNVRSIAQTNYPLALVSGPGDELVLKITYHTGRFANESITRMLGHLQTLLENLVANPNQPLSTLTLLTPAEWKQLTLDWNQTQADYPQDKCVHELFEAQVEQIPHAIALVFEEQHLTYAELNRRANQLAHHLQRLGVGPETRVGICVERSMEMIVGLLGVLKAGGAYLPLDPNYPPDRLAFILHDAQAPVLLTQRKWDGPRTGGLENPLHPSNLPPVATFQPSNPPTLHPSLVYLDADWPIIAQESQANPSSPVLPDNLAYVIYTSGSTGKPKGTLLQHRGLANFANFYAKNIGSDSGSRVLQFASLNFDASLAEIFMSLLTGATLYLARREVLLSLPHLTRLLQEARITTTILPPTLLKMLSPEDVPALHTIISAGEACSPEIALRWGSGRCFFNGYGPTEVTIGPTLYRAENLIEELTSVPIGRPLDNIQVYLLDPYLQPVPIGVPGEVYLGGVGLARGYLNRPDLTAERFIPDPFKTTADPHPSLPLRGGGLGRGGGPPSAVGGRLYKTGDLACYRSDGNLEFLGRIDHQVKIRGFRVELGEIEAALEQHPAVQMAAVVAREDTPGQKQLVAYVTPDNETAPTNSHLRSFLQQSLPDYMLPSTFVRVDKMPLTPSGKIDRRALPAPDGSRPDLAETFVAPRTPEEEILAGMWAQTLGLSRVSLHDNFFELGGHSLLATQLVSRLRDVFQIELPLPVLFEKTTPAQLAEVVRLMSQQEAETPACPIEPAPRTGKLPLSFAQQRLWFLDQLEPDSPYYNIPTVIRLTGPLDAAALERCLNEIVRRHESLRTTFAAVDGQPIPVIAPALAQPLPLVDLTGLSLAEQEVEVRRLAVEEAQRPFDLAQGPLLRACLLRLRETEHVILFTVHHIAADGWSMGVLVREVATLYGAFSAGKPSPLPELALQYADFASWQREWLQGDTRQRQLAYWQQQLSGSPPLLELPTDRPRPAVQSARGALLSFSLPSELTTALRSLSQREGATLFMTLLAAFQTLLYRYTGQEDICVGTPIANRTHREIEGLIGFFVNTLVLRTRLPEGGHLSFLDLLKRVRQVTLGAYAHQDLPFEMLVDELQPRRDLSHTPLFQVMFVLDNTASAPLELDGLTLTPLEIDSGAAKFDLTLSLSDSPDILSGYIEYNTDLFDRETMERLVGHYQTLLAGAVADPNQLISHLPLLTEAEQRRLLVEWNTTAIDFPDQTCIHHLFEAQVEQQPQALAAIYEDQQLTYAELNARANQLAHYLQKLGVGPEALVGISTERSLEMVVGILGILKAGGAYLPLDPTYPADRLAFMLKDSQVAVLLTQQKLEHEAGRRGGEEEWSAKREGLENSIKSSHLPTFQPSIIYLDADWPAIAQESRANPASQVTADNLAYVIYTSGSTGQPKGAMLQHRGLCNLADAQQRAFHIRPGSRVLQFSPFSFDASVWETFMALRNGATLCLARQETLAAGHELARLLAEQRITNVTLPPSVLAVLPPEALPDLETVIAAGEACTVELVKRWAPGRDFFDAYGPTETTVCASMYLCDVNEPHHPPIGRPIANARLYILDKNLQPVPVGVPGELHVGGVSLARGYLNRPDLTAAKFIPNPFGMTADRRPPTAVAELSTVSGRLYKTGDLVRYRADGNIEFLGRIDHQVKVRGFRIELGEIEAALEQYPGVQNSAVAVRDMEGIPGDKRLIAYLVPAAGSELTPGEIRACLRQTLPEYMVPSTFVFLDALPLSPSGKVDRRALPAPDGSRPELERTYVAPRTETERRLAEICASLLGVEKVGIYDNFFDLGGHSLLATQFISRVREAFQVELPLRSLFENPTLAELAVRLETTAGNSRTDVDKIARLLTQIGGLSEDEAKTMLHQKKTLVREGIGNE